MYTRLAGFAGLLALVSTRIYPLMLPQNPIYPAVTYSRVSGQRESAQQADTGVARVRFNVTAWAETYLAGKEVSEQARLALQRYRGTVSGVVIEDIFCLDGPDLFQAEARVFYFPRDFEVWFRE